VGLCGCRTDSSRTIPRGYPSCRGEREQPEAARRNCAQPGHPRTSLLLPARRSRPSRHRWGAKRPRRWRGADAATPATPVSDIPARAGPLRPQHGQRCGRGGSGHPGAGGGRRHDGCGHPGAGVKVKRCSPGNAVLRPRNEDLIVCSHASSNTAEEFLHSSRTATHSR
jgi:hypothetical protein